MSKLKNVFKSGKYTGLTYIEVWEKDPSYMNWMADTYPYFKPILSSLEDRTKTLAKIADAKLEVPTVDAVRAYFKNRSICGFDVSDYVAELYERCPINQRGQYFKSLKQRNP